jgi:hypothetical protein
LQADEELLPDLEVDVREECVKFGPVDNVKVWSFPYRPQIGFLWKTCFSKFFPKCIFYKEIGQNQASWHGSAITHQIVPTTTISCTLFLPDDYC